MSKTKQKLMRARLGRWRPLSSFGYVVFESRAQLKNVLMGSQQQAAAAFFAEGEPDKKYQQVRFECDLPGPVRRLRELSTEERRHALQRLRDVQQALQTATAQLAAQAAGRMSPQTQWLDHACKLPAGVDIAHECMFFVGGEPVLCFWGFDDPEQGAVDLRQWEGWPEVATEGPAAPSAPTLVDAGDSVLHDGAPSTQWPSHAASELPLGSAWADAPKSQAPHTGSRFSKSLAALVGGMRPRLRQLNRRQRWLAAGALSGVLVVLPLLVWATLNIDRWRPLRFDAAGIPITEGRKPGDEMRIPNEALAKADFAFSAGVWQIGETKQAVTRDGAVGPGSSGNLPGSANAAIGSVRRVVQFNGRGSGRVFGVERVYAGKPAPACTADATMRATGQWLYIEHTRCLEHGDGARHLRPMRYECQRLADGRARCSAYDAEGAMREVTIRRLG